MYYVFAFFINEFYDIEEFYQILRVIPSAALAPACMQASNPQEPKYLAQLPASDAHAQPNHNDSPLEKIATKRIPQIFQLPNSGIVEPKQGRTQRLKVFSSHRGTSSMWSVFMRQQTSLGPAPPLEGHTLGVSETHKNEVLKAVKSGSRESEEQHGRAF